MIGTTNENNLVRVPDLHRVFSEWTVRGISSWGEVSHLGRNNIGYLLSRARESEKSISSQIHNLKEKQKMFEKHNGRYFEKLAREFDNPEIRYKGLHPNGGWSQEIEPLGAEHEQRKYGTTTFNICGWCKHASGMSRFGYCISGSCHLLTEMRENANTDNELGNNEVPYYSHEVLFDTSCLLHNLNEKQCEEVVSGIFLKIDALLVKREDVREVIRKLIKLRNNSSSDKPWLVSFRPHNYMNVGDEMAIYIGGWKDKKVNGNWAEGIGIFGYRHHDGCMSYQTLFPIHGNMSYYEGRGGGVGMGRPEALLRSEFDYLYGIARKFSGLAQVWLDSPTENTNSDTVFLSVWFKSINNNFKDFDPVSFFQNLRVPEFVQPPENWRPMDEDIKVRTVKDAENVLHMLNANLFETEKEIKSWANMQLRYVHPDKLSGMSKRVCGYAERQTKAIYDAQKILIERIKNKNKN